MAEQDATVVIKNKKGIKLFYYRLRRAGYSHEEASNMVGAVMGLDVQPEGWSVDELTRLLFFKTLHNKHDLEDIPKPP